MLNALIKSFLPILQEYSLYVRLMDVFPQDFRRYVAQHTVVHAPKHFTDDPQYVSKMVSHERGTSCFSFPNPVEYKNKLLLHVSNMKDGMETMLDNKGIFYVKLQEFVEP